MTRREDFHPPELAKYLNITRYHLRAAKISMRQSSIGFDVIVLERVELVGDVRRFVAQQFDLLLVRLEDVQRRLNLLQFGVHVALCVVDDAAEASESAGKFSAEGILMKVC